MSVKIDELLKEALIPSEKPDAQLNQEILRKVSIMKGHACVKYFLLLENIILLQVLRLKNYAAY